jgi:Ca2+-binding EF-hand superfamily protein
MKDYLLNRVACNPRELYELFEKLDISRNGTISREDFLREITPIDDQVREPGGDEGVSAEAEGHFLSLIIEYLQRFRVLEVARREIASIAPYRAFAELDTFKTGLIGLDDLRRFLDNNEYELTERQLILLFHGLRRRCYL